MIEILTKGEIVAILATVLGCIGCFIMLRQLSIERKSLLNLEHQKDRKPNQVKSTVVSFTDKESSGLHVVPSNLKYHFDFIELDQAVASNIDFNESRENQRLRLHALASYQENLVSVKITRHSSNFFTWIAEFFKVYRAYKAITKEADKIPLDSESKGVTRDGSKSSAILLEVE